MGGGLVPDKNDLTQLNQSIEARLTRLEQAISGRVDQVAGKVDKFETIPSGFVMYSACLANNPSWLLCDGRAVSRAAYANLFRAIGTTWGAGNGSTTFNVPYLLERVAWGSNGGIGQYIDSGAPEIWGTIGDLNDFDNDTSIVGGALEPWLRWGALGNVHNTYRLPCSRIRVG